MRATLYVGLTQVLHVCHLGAARFALKRQEGKGFASLDAALFDPSWAVAGSLERLASAWHAVMAYVHAAIEASPPSRITKEGRLHALLVRGGPDFAVID